VLGCGEFFEAYLGALLGRSEFVHDLAQRIEILPAHGELFPVMLAQRLDQLEHGGLKFDGHGFDDG
jgi:hypothetical protein